MPNDADVLYWDADVLLSYINGVEGRVEHVRALLADADNGVVDIFTSMLSVTEVAFAAQEKAQRQLSEQEEAAIRALWLPESPLRLVEFHLLIAERSRGLLREAVGRGWGLKPADAIHLASAENVSATKLCTYNLADFEKWGPVLGFDVEQPTSANPQML